MIKLDFCGPSIECSDYFNETKNINPNVIHFLNSWDIELSPGLNNITLNETHFYKKGSLLVLKAQTQIVSTHSSVDKNRDFSINEVGNDSVALNPLSLTYCIRALTRRYNYYASGSISKEFSQSGTYLLMANIYDDYFRNYLSKSYTILVNPARKYNFF